MASNPKASVLRRAGSPLVLLAAGLVAAAVVFVLDRAPWRKRPQGTNVLLISLDTTRRDHLSCYGYHRETTPHIDAVADDGLLFERCVAVSNWTLPTHASMLSGLYPTTHGAHFVTPDVPHVDTKVNPGNPGGLMSQASVTLPEVLGEAGYRTAAVVANSWYLQRGFQLDQGFDLYDDRASEDDFPYRRAAEIADEALRWLEQSDERPFFLLLNFLDPHVPYDAPPPFKRKFRDPNYPEPPLPIGPSVHWQMIQDQVMTNGNPLSAAGRVYFENRYDGEIAYMDEQIGRIFAWLRDERLYDSTLVIVTADHGEAFGEHLVMGHGLALHEPEVAVPMILKLPFSGRRGRVEYGVQHVDILPTVLEVLELPVPGGAQGTSMLVTGDRDLFVEQYIYPGSAKRWPRFNREQRAVYRGNFKYVAYSDGERALFDLASDPAEEANLVNERPDDANALELSLRDWRERTKPLEEQRSAPIPVTPEDAERLRELGYFQ